jgi:hypothetical protein
MDPVENSECQSYGLPAELNLENLNFEEGLLELDASVRPQKHYPLLASLPTPSFANLSHQSAAPPVMSPRSKLSMRRGIGRFRLLSLFIWFNVFYYFIV